MEASQRLHEGRKDCKGDKEVNLDEKNGGI